MPINTSGCQANICCRMALRILRMSDKPLIAPTIPIILILSICPNETAPSACIKGPAKPINSASGCLFLNALISSAPK